jgi:hypothetical protein
MLAGPPEDTFSYVPNIYDLAQSQTLPGAVPGCRNNITGNYEELSMCNYEGFTPAPSDTLIPAQIQPSTTATEAAMVVPPHVPPLVASLAPSIPISMPYELTPANIVNPLPDITAATSAVAITPPSFWCDVNLWVAQNPLLAGLLVVGVTAMLWRKK